MRLLKQEVRKDFSLGEEIANAVTHGIGFLLGVTALVLLMVKSSQVGLGVYTFSMLVYSLSLIILYGNSMLYHGFPAGRGKAVFERLDHASVYLLIAGTYTPFCLLVVGGTLGIVACSIQWGLAITGVVFKSIWIDRFVKVHVLIYLLLGWGIVFFARQVISALELPGFLLLLAGGLAYSIGVLFYVFDWFKYHHLVWHLFVLVGSLLHFLCVYLYIAG